MFSGGETRRPSFLVALAVVVGCLSVAVFPRTASSAVLLEPKLLSSPAPSGIKQNDAGNYVDIASSGSGQVLTTWIDSDVNSNAPASAVVSAQVVGVDGSKVGPILRLGTGVMGQPSDVSVAFSSASQSWIIAWSEGSTASAVATRVARVSLGGALTSSAENLPAILGDPDVSCAKASCLLVGTKRVGAVDQVLAFVIGEAGQWLGGPEIQLQPSISGDPKKVCNEAPVAVASSEVFAVSWVHAPNCFSGYPSGTNYRTLSFDGSVVSALRSFGGGFRGIRAKYRPSVGGSLVVDSTGSRVLEQWTIGPPFESVNFDPCSGKKRSYECRPAGYVRVLGPRLNRISISRRSAPILSRAPGDSAAGLLGIVGIVPGKKRFALLTHRETAGESRTVKKRLVSPAGRLSRSSDLAFRFPRKPNEDMPRFHVATERGSTFMAFGRLNLRTDLTESWYARTGTIVR